MIATPLRLSRDRVMLYGVALALICLVQVKFVVAQQFGDWTAFWSAGATADSANLLDPQQHIAWQHAHHLPTTIFPYLPGAAFFFVPFSWLPLPVSYAVNFIVMAALVIGAGAVAAHIYRLNATLSTVLLFAWAPVTAALATGQNSPAGLLLALVAVLGLIADANLWTGVAVGALLYKPTYALPLIVLLAIRGKFRALAIVAAVAAGWYVLSVAATAGDWNWPAHYAAALHAYFGPDAVYNAQKAISIPSLLIRAGITQPVAIAAGAVFFALAVPLIARMPILEAASFVPLIGLASSPHVLPYDLALAAPALFYFMTHASEPLRTRVVLAIYLVAPLWLLSGVAHFDVLAILCNGFALAWLVKGYYEPTPRQHFDVAHPGDRSQA